MNKHSWSRLNFPPPLFFYQCRPFSVQRLEDRLSINTNPHSLWGIVYAANTCIPLWDRQRSEPVCACSRCLSLLHNACQLGLAISVAISWHEFSTSFSKNQQQWEEALYLQYKCTQLHCHSDFFLSIILIVIGNLFPNIFPCPNCHSFSEQFSLFFHKLSL